MEKAKCKRKKDCWHYWHGECKTLESLVCEERDCSFYENSNDYMKRQAEFNRKYTPIVPKSGPKY